MRSLSAPLRRRARYAAAEQEQQAGVVMTCGTLSGVSVMHSVFMPVLVTRMSAAPNCQRGAHQDRGERNPFGRYAGGVSLKASIGARSNSGSSPRPGTVRGASNSSLRSSGFYGSSPSTASVSVEGRERHQRRHCIAIERDDGDDEDERRDDLGAGVQPRERGVPRGQRLERAQVAQGGVDAAHPAPLGRRRRFSSRASPQTAASVAAPPTSPASDVPASTAGQAASPWGSLARAEGRP